MSDNNAVECPKHEHKTAESVQKLEIRILEEKFILVQELSNICVSNSDYFQNDNTIIGSRLLTSFNGLKENLEKSLILIEIIVNFSHEYDFDENTKGNGYESFVYIYHAAVNYSMKIAKYISDNRGSLLFRKNLYFKEIDVCNQMFGSLFIIFENLIAMHKDSECGDLYANDNSHENYISKAATVINQTCFYGRAIGFQYCDSIKPILRFINISMASFSEGYFSTGYKLLKTTTSIFTSSKFFLDPELCAQRIVNVTHNSNINFCKSFWFLAEGKLMHSIPSIVGYKVEMNKVITIPPEPMQMMSEKTNELVDIPLPCGHTEPGSVEARLLSARRRFGMVGEKKNCLKSETLEPSKYLLIHSHGGGWVAQSSKSHELYLREWAVKMDIPIFSIDYSLAPEAPFPRAFEDVFYAYCWALKNCELLGSTGENIVMAGDSAGANLNTACILKCIEMGIRKPRGIFNAYCPFVVNFASTPARFMAMLDPLLPYGFIMRCLKAYGTPPAGSESKEFKNNKIITKEIVYDDNQDEQFNLSPDSTKALENMWHKIESNAELNAWQTNLSSITEMSPEEPVSPLLFDAKNKSPDDIEKNDEDAFVSKFIEKYRSTSSEETKDIKETISIENIPKTQSEERKETTQSFQDKIQQVTNDFVSAISTPFKLKRPEHLSFNKSFSFDETKEKRANFYIPKADEADFTFSVPRNHFMSPFWAPDELLKDFPPMKILTLILDPCLDDCVMFGKKLKKLGVKVDMDILEGLPHGFLNFASVSKEAHEGSMVCMQRVAELLDLPLNSELEIKTSMQ